MNDELALAQLVEDDDYCKKLGSTLEPVIGRYTVSIVLEDGKSLRQHGTGTLLRIAERSFLTTAAHVVAVQHELFIYGAEGKGLMQLDGKRIRTVGQPDVFDLAIIELDDQEVEHLSGFKFIRLIDVMTNDFGPDLYFVTGFPSAYTPETNDQNQKLYLKRFYCFSYPTAKTSHLENFDAKYHIALHGKHEDAVPLGDSEPLPPTTLRGISGCGIWKTNAIAVPRDAWTPDHAKLAAVQTCEYRSAIRGTNWLGIATMIYQRFPELRAALGLLLPRRIQRV